MLKRTVLTMLALALAAGTAFAQASETVKFYKLDFVVKEVEGGKVLNARAYSLTAAADARETASMRTGTRIPVGTGPSVTPQFQYIDVGVNIDCRSIKEVQRDLALSVSAEISSLPSEPAQPAAAGTTGPVAPPAVRQNRWISSVIVPLKRPTLLFSSDDPASKRQMQLELTATPIAQ